MAEKLGALTAIGEKVREVQALWKDIYCCRTFVQMDRNGTGYWPMVMK